MKKTRSLMFVQCVSALSRRKFNHNNNSTSDIEHGINGKSQIAYVSVYIYRYNGIIFATACLALAYGYVYA